MNHILLVNTPWSDDFSVTRAEENLGLLYIEASLKKSGYRTSIIDGLACDLSYEDIMKEILLRIPSIFIGFSAYANNIKNTVKMAKELRTCGYKGHITTGGMWPSFKYREILSQIKEIDSVCVGEGEELSVELADAIAKAMDLKHIRGLATVHHDGTINFTSRKFKDNIDSFPVPDRSGYYLGMIKKKEYASIMFSRGCHGRCTFCNIASYINMCGGEYWRHRSPDAVVDEIEYIIKTTGVKVFDFVDDNFFGRDEKDRENCFLLGEEILKRKLDVRFSVACRVQGMDYELLNKLKEAGLVEVTLGIESWSEEQIKRYNKKLTVRDIEKAIEILHRVNLSYKCFIIPLDPYVTREELIENLDRMEKHRPLDHTFVYSQFFGTIRLDPYMHIFKKCLKDNLIEDFNEHDLDNYDIRYRQFHPEIQGIADAGRTIWTVFCICTTNLNVTGKKKNLPVYQWDRIKRDILLALKKLLYNYFREYISTGGNNDGSEFIYKRTEKICKDICSFAKNIKREELMELKEYIIDIGGIKISTRPEGFNEFIERILR